MLPERKINIVEELEGIIIEFYVRNYFYKKRAAKNLSNRQCTSLFFNQNIQLNRL